MNIRPLLIVGGATIAAMLAISAWAWPQLPADAQVPIHWGISGEADGYAQKWVGLLGIPAVAVLVLGLLAVLPRFEPRRGNLERSGTAYGAIGVAVMVFIGALHAVAVMAALGGETDTTSVALIGAGILFVVIGNFIGKTRSSWFFGIRTPWTLSSERSWGRTHRLGGRLFIGVGLLVILAAALIGNQVAVWVMLGGLLGTVLALFAYSYLVWRDDPARNGAGAGR